MTDELLDHIIDCTNAFLGSEDGKKKKTRTPKTPKNERTASDWQLTRDEFLRFVAVLILIDYHGKPTLERNWSKDPHIVTPIFGQTMTLDRFMTIHRNLKFKKSEDVVDDGVLRFERF